MNAVNELREFHRFLGAKLENGGADLLPEEALEEWRQIHPEPWDEEDDVAAIQAAMDDLDNGVKTISLQEVDREIRKRFNFPDHSKP
jgi:hypothetical protein